MIVNSISDTPFCCHLNGKTYKLEWLKSPKLYSVYDVDVGIDQSSTSTGICIQSKDLLFLTELPRDAMTVNEYKIALKKELQYLLRTLNIKHFIYEKHKNIAPVESVINDITATLKSYTKSLDKDYVKIVGISPGVWRKGFFSNKEYDEYNRDHLKVACVNLAIKERPELEGFKKFSHKDYDAFEAYGIINGYLKLNYTKNGIRIVNTSMDYKYGRKYKYILKKCDKSESEISIDYLRKTYGSSETPIVLANKELLLENSLNRIIGEYKDAILVIPKHSEFPSYILETEEHYNPGDMFIAYVTRTS